MPLILGFQTELILQHIGHFLHHKINVGILIPWPSSRPSRHPCGRTVPRIWESINGTVVHEFRISTPIHVPLWPIICWGYPVSRARWNSRRAECQFSISRPIGRCLIRVLLLDWLTSHTLQRRLSTCILSWLAINGNT
jgi:hypothetical protein